MSEDYVKRVMRKLDEVLVNEDRDISLAALGILTVNAARGTGMRRKEFLADMSRQWDLAGRNDEARRRKGLRVVGDKPA